MSKRKKVVNLSLLAVLLLAVALVAGCSLKGLLGGSEQPSEEASEEEQVVVSQDPLQASSYALDGRVFLVTQDTVANIPDYVPVVEPYQAAADLSNIENLDRFYLQDQMKEKLAANNFVIVDSSGSEFFDQYESNRYAQLPSFITVDSMMHTYHLYFAYLQKNTELNYLNDDVASMSTDMLENSKKQYEELKGSEWEEAAKINVAFFTVGASLIGENPTVESYVSDVVEQEIEYVNAAGGVAISPLMDAYEDYSQYKPRGYYEGNETLEKYFRTMMWYGHRNFAQESDTMNRCALLMSLALRDDAAKNWEEVYSITSFFAGASDDAGTYEYLPLIYEAFGDSVQTADLIGNEDAYAKYTQLTDELPPPAINSVVFDDDGGATDKNELAKGYRFMGQRFSVDAAIFTQLCYDKVKANPNGELRMLPDALDVPAALGSDTAYAILRDAGNCDFAGYEDNMNAVRTDIATAPDTLWTASLYGGWMNTLRPLLNEKGTGYPSFMLSEEWTKKDLETFLSSYTELKHDTVLYSKQFVAEMGGGDEEPLDDRGYVEPEVEVYAYLSALASNTSKGLQDFGIISDNDINNLQLLSDLADRLKEISVKELTCAEITDDDYQLIRDYGGNLEHFWKETVKDENGESYYESRMYPAALVVDIATDPNGAVLEEAIGPIAQIYVVVPVEGKLRIATGSVFSYYQFTQPLSDRLTDSEWRRMLGMELNDNDEYVVDESVVQPNWTQSYRTQFVYNYEY